MKKNFLIILLAVLGVAGVASPGAEAATPKRGFAIFVDSATNAFASPEIEAYAGTVRNQGLATQTVVLTPSVTPDSIRTIIRTMATRKDSPIEGFVMIGEVPVPMILDAQHMSSAFKAVQNPKRLERSAIPSDRFYDDLDLQFSFVSRDPKKPVLYYYSLTCNSPQTAEPELYSGRIRGVEMYGKTKAENVRDYLRKLVRIKSRNEQMNRMLLFAGSGYNSESMIARLDERVAMLEQFPRFKSQPRALTFVNHSHAVNTKYPLMSHMQGRDLSLALLHHHGSPVKEFINRFPDARNVQTQLEQARMFFRGKIRSAIENGEPRDSAIARYCKDYDVPTYWFDNILDPKSIAEDSLYADRLDLHITDFGKYRPNARVVILDACFNGSFNNDKYIAGAYIFGEGDCVVSIANSVNSLQDKWCDKYLGLLDHGVRVGHLVRMNPYLESHIIGDPTFAFSPRVKDPVDINQALASDDVRYWKKQYAKPTSPVMQSLALERLYRNGAVDNAGLLEAFRTSPSYLVRFGALMDLSTSHSPEFVKAISLGLDDSYELIRRFSAIFAGKQGSPELIPAVVKSYADDFKGERVNFQLQNAMVHFADDALLKELDRSNPFRDYYDADSLKARAKSRILDRFSDKVYDDRIEELAKENPDKREVMSFIRQSRNHPLHTGIDEIFAYLEKCDDEKTQLAIVESFGWYNYSHRAAHVADLLSRVANNSRYSQAVRNEAVKSINRLK